MTLLDASILCKLISDVEVEVGSECCFNLLLLDPDVTLRYGGTAELQELLNQGNIIVIREIYWLSLVYF